MMPFNSVVYLYDRTYEQFHVYFAKSLKCHVYLNKSRINDLHKLLNIHTNVLQIQLTHDSYA